MRQQFRYLSAAAPPRRKFPWAGKHFGTGLRRVVVLNLTRELRSVILGHLGLGIEQIDVAWPTLHEQRDHRAGARLVVWRLRLHIECSLLQLRTARLLGEQIILL